jgi:RNA polymerase sigma-70 factor (ECF subfamily)
VTAETPPPPPRAGNLGEPFDPDERELIRRCQAGETAAFEPLVAKYRERVWRLAYQLLRDREEAWDAAQDAFVRAFQSLSSFRGQAAFYTWLFRITVNVAMDRQRARGARARAFGADRVPEEEWARTTPDPGAGPDQAALEAERRARIGRALDALPPPARAIIMLSDVQGLSYREIAQVLNCPLGTVMSRLHNARKRLRALLGPTLGVVLAVVALVPGWAGEARAQAPMVRFGVRVLQASSPPEPRAAPRATPPGALAPQQSLVPPGARAPAEAEADERLKQILPRLRTLFRYTEYTTLERHRAEVAVGGQHLIPIVGSRRLEVIPDAVQGGSVRMRVRLLRGDQHEIRTTIVAAPGAPAVLGGPPHGDGALIIILWAHPKP